MNSNQKTASRQGPFPLLSEKNVNMKKEILAGITTFLTMAYIIAVNPSTLAASS